MKLPLQITTRGFPHSEALDNHIREKAAKLVTFYPGVMGCRVMVEVPHKHKHNGRAFNVRLDITVPGKELVVNHEPHEDAYVAVNDAFDAAMRQLEDYERRQRFNVKVHTAVLYGRVVRIFLDEGYGFIATPDGQELYFHRDNLPEGNFEKLEVGSEVHFLEDIAGEGLQAKRVSAGKHHVPEGEAEPE